VEAGWGITRIDLEVAGRVPGLDQAGFAAAAEAASTGCPVSKAFHGNVEIGVRSRLLDSASTV